MTIEIKNNCILAYMGGPDYLRKFFTETIVDMDMIKPSDLKFHESWDWMIPVWSKLRHELTPTMILHAINCIDSNSLEPLHEMISNVCMQWCKEHGIKVL